MATSTTKLSLRKPDPTDTVNVTTDIGNNMDIIDTEMGFQAVIANPSSPYTGKVIYRTDQDKAYAYNGAVWRQFTMDHNIREPVTTFTSTDMTTTSTSYANLSTDLNTTFIAPSSGRGVYVNITGRLEVTAGETIFLSYEIRETDGSGVIVHAATDDVKSVIVQDQYNLQATVRSWAPGLTGGNTYFIRCRVRVSGGTGTIFYAGILVEPVL